jgi:hypothetical protein
MSDINCEVIKDRAPELSPRQIDNLINSWDQTKSAFENLMGTTWSFNRAIYELPEFSTIYSDRHFNRYNKLQILSDKILISNLTYGFRDIYPSTKSVSESNSCSPGYIELKYALNDTTNQTIFLENTENNGSRFKIQLLQNTEDVPGSTTDTLYVEVNLDPLSNEDPYNRIESTNPAASNLRTDINQPLKGLDLKLTINFAIEDCGELTVEEQKERFFDRIRANYNSLIANLMIQRIEERGQLDNVFTRQGTVNRLASENANHRTTYWSRIKVKNLCQVPQSLLSDYAVNAKCLKYKAGNYSDNVENIYHNMVVTGAINNNLITDNNFNNQRCGTNGGRGSVEKLACLNTNPELTHEKNRECSQALNCEWDRNVQNSLLAGSDSDIPCPGQSDLCLLNSSESTKDSVVGSIRDKMLLYYEYQQHRNPYNNLLSEFGESCDANTLVKIEDVCRDKNIGINFRWEPVSCDPGHPEFNRETCTSNCGTDGSCNSPVLVSEPDLSAFRCDLEGLDQLEMYCKRINDSIINNPDYQQLGYESSELQIPSYNISNYPYTGCNRAAVDQHLMYIRSIIMSRIAEINGQINEVIESGAANLEAYSKRRNERMTKLRENIETNLDQIINLNQNTLVVMERIGTVNNRYNDLRVNLIEFNSYLDGRLSKKKNEFIVLIFFSIIIINILFFIIFFRKK